MWKIATAELLSHKRRLIGTCSAIILGVALLAGTLVLGDTMRASFNTVFSKANAGISVVVRGSESIGSDSTAQRNSIPASTLDDVASIDGVAAASPVVSGIGQLVGADGKPLGGNGPPTLAGNWGDDPELNPYQLAEGRAPQGPGEVVIDMASSKTGKLPIGSTTTVFLPDPVTVTVVGLAKYGDAESLGGTSFTGFSLPEAQRLILHSPDVISSVALRAEPGVSDDELLTRVQPALPTTTEALTGPELTEEQNADIESDFLGFFETFLLVFTGVAMLVAALSIANTFAVILAQRTRQSALLRALGASRQQILRSITIEAVAIGLVASVIGLGIGVLLAAGLMAGAEAGGFGVPSAGLEITLSTGIVSIGIGLAVTVLASLLPAVKASRVAPLAALRDVSQDRSATSKVRNIGGAIAMVAGIGLVISGAVGSGGLSPVAFGSLLTTAGVLLLGPVLARPASQVLGAPIRAFRGVPGGLASENAQRNPRRTASTASALLIGLGVVTLFSVFGASIKTSIDDAASKGFHGDLVVQTGGFSGAGLSPAMVATVAELPDVSSASALSNGAIRIGDGEKTVSIVDPASFQQFFGLDVTAGDMAQLPPDSVVVSTDMAEDEGWSEGTSIPVTFGDGTTTALTVGAVYEKTDLISGMLVPEVTWAPHATQTFTQMMLIKLADGVSVAEGQAAVTEVAAQYGSPEVMDREQYVDSVSSQVDAFLTIVYVLLALSVFIALMGIANTLSLAIHERTRELGLLRAIGQTRAQLRSMVRWESVVVATFGALTGVVLGTFLAWGLVKGAMADEGLGSFSAPVGQLVFIVVVGAGIGIVASLRPAARAAKLDVLKAITAD